MPVRPAPLSFLLAALLAGCALTGCVRLSKPDATAGADAARATHPAARLASTPAGGMADATEAPPRWAPTQELITGATAEPVAAPAGPVFDLSDQGALRAQVRDRCAAVSPRDEPAAELAALAGALLVDGVEAGRALDAMYRARCGTLGAVVRALVSRGGPPVVASVVDRALFLGGPAAEPMVTAAVSAGLQRDLNTLAPTSGREPGARDAAALRYAMAYFPVAARQAEIAEADDLATLYDSARPGYGLYTFILAGAGENPQALETWRELLRVIETYVLVAGQGAELPLAETHAFLVPLRPERSGAVLLEQTEPTLAAPMRAAFAAQLSTLGRADLAMALTGAPGPFLITTLEPALVGRDPRAARLLVDLSGVGPEYAYAVIDAFDRPIPPELTGQPTSLLPVEARLAGVLTPPGPDTAALTAVHLLGERPPPVAVVAVNGEGVTADDSAGAAPPAP